MTYTIGEMAKLLNVAPSALRYYDKEGLLPFMKRTEGGTRVFRESDVEVLKIIHCLKSTGMRIKDIKEFISLVMQGDESINARLSLFRNQKLEVEKQLVQLHNTMDMIDFKCWYYETAKSSGTTLVPDNMHDEDLPDNIRKIRAKFRQEISGL